MLAWLKEKNSVYDFSLKDFPSGESVVLMLYSKYNALFSKTSKLARIEVYEINTETKLCLDDEAVGFLFMDSTMDQNVFVELRKYFVKWISNPVA